MRCLRIIIHTIGRMCCIFILLDGYFLSHRAWCDGDGGGPVACGQHHSDQGCRRRRQRIRRAGAASLAGRPLARAHHRRDVVLARWSGSVLCPRWPESGTAQSSRFPLARLDRRGGRGLPGAAGRSRSHHRPCAHRAGHPGRGFVRCVPAARPGGSGKVVSGDESQALSNRCTG